MQKEKEDKRFIKVLQHHGKDYKKLMKEFPALTYEQIYDRTKYLKLRILADKSHPNSHLKKVLEKKSSVYWSKKEEATFVKMFKKYGKNYILIKARIPTKT